MSSARVSRSRTTLFVAWASIVAQGCVIAPLPPPKYYVVSADTSSSRSVGDEEGLRVLDPRASEALRPGLTVAFFPPDICRGDLSAATATATPEATDMANYCGVLISALETSVADRYSVVSWQTIKGPDPFERAAARKVDIIFEVDSMGLSQLGQDATSELRLDFYQQSNANDRSLLNLGPGELPNIAGRCKAGIEIMLADQSSTMVRSFTGAIKAVEVSSGQALVYYQRTLTDDESSTQHEGLDVYFEAKPVAGPARYNGLQQAGAAATGVGFFGAVIAGTLRGLVYTGKLDAADRNRQPETAISSASLVASVIVLVGGVTMLVIGNAKAKRTVQQVPFQAPGEVICVQPSTPPWLAPAPAPVEGPTQGGSSYSFTDVQTAQRDLERERENHLRKLLIDDFTAELAKLDAAAAPAP